MTPTKPRLRSQLVATVVGLLLGCWAEGAEFDFYERFSSLIETNRSGPPLTNGTLSLNKLTQTGEIAGVKLGTGMSAAVELWGRPRNFYASCGGGPVLMFGHGSLNFRGDKVVRISISPNSIPGLCFEGGLTATNTPTQFAKALGLPAPGPAQWRLTFESETAVVELNWNHFAVGGWQLSWLSLEAPGQRDATNAIAPPGLLYMTSLSNTLSISNAVKLASGLRAGMAKADVDKYMEAHGMMQTNIYSVSLDRGRTLTCPYPLAGSATSLMLEMQCSQVRPGLFGWGNPVLSRAYIQSEGANIISITLTDAP